MAKWTEKCTASLQDIVCVGSVHCQPSSHHVQQKANVQEYVCYWSVAGTMPTSPKLFFQSEILF